MTRVRLRVYQIHNLEKKCSNPLRATVINEYDTEEEEI